jgi:hypothetical protein
MVQRLSKRRDNSNFVADYSDSHRSILMRGAAATWGLAIAFACLPLLSGPPHAGQLPGVLSALHLDARIPFRFLLLVISLPLCLVLLLEPVFRILQDPDTHRWSRIATIFAMLAPLWFVTIERDLTWIIGPTLIMTGYILLMRKVNASFSRHDIVLIPVSASVFLSLLDVLPVAFHKNVLLAAAIVFTIRVSLVLIKPTGYLPSAMCFVAAPLALICQSSFFSRDQRHFGWLPLGIATLTPLLLRSIVRDSAVRRRWVRRTIAYVVFPIASFMYSSAVSIQAAEGKPRADFFETAHTILPGAEMLNHKKPYQDIIPTHGLLSDGLVPYLTLRAGPADIGHALKTRLVIESLNKPAEYFLTLALTGSPEAGIAAFLLAETFGSSGGPLRMLPAIIAIAFAAAALRLRSVPLIVFASVCVVVAFLTGIDFGAYSAGAVIAAGALFGKDRRTAITRSAIAATIAGGLSLAILFASGILKDFVWYLRKLPSLTGAYALPPLILPEGLKKFRFPPELLLSLFDKTSFLYTLWFAALIGMVITLHIRPRHVRRRSQLNSLRCVLVFMLICAGSYAERHHLYFQYAVAPVIIACIWWLLRHHGAVAQLMARILIIAVLMIAQPTIHLAIAASLRSARGPLDPGWREVLGNRTRGAYFNEANAVALETARSYLDTHLARGDTYFDFTNRGGMYFLVGRECPIRFVEVSFYERPELQQEVIDRIRANPHVRVALMPSSDTDGLTTLDGVPNATRAPAVWEYLSQNFEPDFNRHGVVFWRRKLSSFQ